MQKSHQSLEALPLMVDRLPCSPYGVPQLSGRCKRPVTRAKLVKRHTIVLTLPSAVGVRATAVAAEIRTLRPVSLPRRRLAPLKLRVVSDGVIPCAGILWRKTNILYRGRRAPELGGSPANVAR